MQYLILVLFSQLLIVMRHLSNLTVTTEIPVVESKKIT